MVDAAVSDPDIDDGWSLEEAAAEPGAGAHELAMARAPEPGEELETDDGWDLEEIASASSVVEPAAKADERDALTRRASDPSRIVRLPGRVVIYPRRAVREKKLSALWDHAIAQGGA